MQSESNTSRNAYDVATVRELHQAGFRLFLAKGKVAKGAAGWAFKRDAAGEYVTDADGAKVRTDAPDIETLLDGLADGRTLCLRPGDVGEFAVLDVDGDKDLNLTESRARLTAGLKRFKAVYGAKNLASYWSMSERGVHLIYGRCPMRGNVKWRFVDPATGEVMLSGELRADNGYVAVPPGGEIKWVRALRAVGPGMKPPPAALFDADEPRAERELTFPGRPDATAPPPTRDITRDEVIDALGLITAPDREKWFRVMGAVHHWSGGSEDGWNIADTWSRTVAGGEYDAERNRADWDSMKHDGKITTAATLLFYAGTGKPRPVEFDAVEDDSPKRPTKPQRPKPSDLGDDGGKALADRQHSPVSVDGPFIAALHPSPEDVLYWPLRNRTYAFEPSVGLWESDPRDGKLQATLFSRAARTKVTVENADGVRERDIKVTRSSVADGAAVVKHGGLHPAPPFDADPHLAGCPSGVIDLRTGEVRKGERSEYVLGRLGVTPKPGPTPTWDEFMDYAFPVAEERVYVETLLASLLGGVRVDQVTYFQGPGASGKTTLLTLMKSISGKYASSFPKGTVTRERGERPPGHRSWLIPLRFARWAVAPETKQSHIVDGTLLNDLTGGGWVRADAKFGAEEEWQSYIKCVLYGNEKPRFAVNSGVERRLVRIVMGRVKPKLERDTALDVKLWKEAPAIAARLVGVHVKRLAGEASGEHAFMPPPPSDWRAATRELLLESDARQRFIDDVLEFEHGAFTSHKLMTETIRRWWEEEGLSDKPKSSGWLGQPFDDRSPRVYRDRSSQGSRPRGWRGVKIKLEYMQPEGMEAIK